MLTYYADFANYLILIILEYVKVIDSSLKQEYQYCHYATICMISMENQCE